MAKQSSAMRALSILHLTILIAQIIFAVVVVVLVSSKMVSLKGKEVDSILQVVAIAVAAAGFFIGTKKFKKSLQEIRESTMGAQKKFEKYRSASILLWAMIQGPSVLCIISFFLTGNFAFMALAAVLIFLLFIFGPTRQKLTLFLGLSEQDIDNLQ